MRALVGASRPPLPNSPKSSEEKPAAVRSHAAKPNSQLGFAATSAILIGTLTVLARGEPTQAVARLRGHLRLPAIGAYAGQVLMAATAFVVARLNHDPTVARRADALAGAAIVIGLPAVLLTALHWRSLTVARSRDRGPEPDPCTPTE